jgi:hypothetical protein
MKSFLTILNEQKYNTNRLYFKGSAFKKSNKNKRGSHYLYLTPDIFYAYDYTRYKKQFFIQIYKLNTPLNIFNPLSDKDMKKLNSIVNQKMGRNLTEDEIDYLKKYDWEEMISAESYDDEDMEYYNLDTKLEKNPNNKKALQAIMKSPKLGKNKIVEFIKPYYDGFFNWETRHIPSVVHSPVYENYFDSKEKFNDPEYNPNIYILDKENTAPAVALFDDSNATYFGYYDEKTILKNDKFREKYNNSLKNIEVEYRKWLEFIEDPDYKGEWKTSHSIYGKKQIQNALIDEYNLFKEEDARKLFSKIDKEMNKEYGYDIISDLVKEYS